MSGDHEREPVMRTRRDYIFQRPGSANWWIKLRSGSKRIERSLGTPDKHQAEILAFDFIKAHKAALLAAKPRLETAWRQAYAPGLHALPEGGHIAATARELSIYDAAGALLRTEPNGQPVTVLANVPDSTTLRIPKGRYGGEPIDLSDFSAITVTDKPGRGAIDLGALERPTLAAKSPDDAILETYLRHGHGKVARPIIGADAKEARDLWATFRQVTGNKALKDCTRADGRALVEHLQGTGLKSASIVRKVGRLRAACALAVEDGKLERNPFMGVAKRGDDALQREPFDDADMAIMAANLHRLSDHDALLLRMLASTGMRLSEPFEIGATASSGDKIESGVRYVIVGSKTDSSRRRVPFPAELLPHLPARIKGPLFKSKPENAGKRLGRFLKAIGVGTPAKPLHALRHRAQDRLRAAGCPEDVRHALLGHDHVTVADSYGKGFPVAILKQWADKIGGPAANMRALA
jgi:integrase